MARTTQTQDWLALGYRHDNPDLWEQLCLYLEANGACTDSQLPRELMYLVTRAKENTYTTWLYDHYLMPIWYRRGHSSHGGNGWMAKKDWQERLAIMRNPISDLLASWMQQTYRQWREKAVKKRERAQYVYDEPWNGDWANKIECSYCGAFFLPFLPLDAYDDEAAFDAIPHTATCPMIVMPQKIAALRQQGDLP